MNSLDRKELYVFPKEDLWNAVKKRFGSRIRSIDTVLDLNMQYVTQVDCDEKDRPEVIAFIAGFEEGLMNLASRLQNRSLPREHRNGNGIVIEDEIM